MSSRPRRLAARRANEAIADMAISNRVRSGNSLSPSPSPSPSTRNIANRGASKELSSPILSLLPKERAAMPPSKPRQAVSPSGARNGQVNKREQFEGGEILDGKRSRRVKKSYVIRDSDDEEDEPEDDDDDARGEDDGEDDDEDMEDAEGEEDDDAEGEEDDDMDVDTVETPQRAPPAIKITKPKTTPSPAKPKTTTARFSARAALDDDDDDDELSDPDSDAGMEFDQTMQDDEEEEDAEGEEDEEDEVDDEPVRRASTMAGEDDDDAEGEPDSDDEFSRFGTPDLSKMTRRQRARFEDSPQQHMKLSDEVQVKKHFTAEELSMRRAEMARRRRNLSDKRTEEVKMETINKLLKKQAPKGKGKGGAGENGDDPSDPYNQRPSPAFVRWINTHDGSRIGVPSEMLQGPVGVVYGGPSALAPGAPRRLIEEVP